MRLSADVYEEGEDLVVVIDLPGSRPREIEFLVDATLLCLQVQRSGEDREPGRTYPRRGRGPERVCGYVPLPVRVLPGDIRASLREGVLEVRMNIDKESETVVHYEFSAGSPRSSGSGPPEPVHRRGREVP